MKIRAKQLDDKERIVTLDALYTAAGALRGRDAMKSFFKDLLTESERIMLGRRILIARALLHGESARSIADRMKVGNDTIYKVEKWLEDQLPGYEEAIAGLETEFDKRKSKNPELGTLAYMKKKYPLHFLFFPSYGPKKKQLKCKKRN